MRQFSSLFVLPQSSLSPPCKALAWALGPGRDINSDKAAGMCSEAFAPGAARRIGYLAP